jgi:large subunit ribosomal protein L19e
MLWEWRASAEFQRLNEVNEISMANSRKNIWKLVKNGFVIKNPMKIHSRSYAHRALETKRNGCHYGYGKNKGTKEDGK